MADYKVVDVEKLETELTEVAEEVRILADTQEKMSINKMTENVAQANDTIELQRDIILEIKTTLEGKAGGSKEEQEKTLNITENGNYEVLPDEGKALSKVNVDVNVSLEGELGKPYLDTSKITNFSYFGCTNRVNAWIDNIDTSNGKVFNHMFDGCNRLYEIPLFDTSKGTDFSYMFYNCAIKNLPPLDTSKGTNFSYMFFQTGLTVIPSLDISSATTCLYMFSSNIKLKSVPLLDISNSESCVGMFSGCSALETVSLTTAKANFTESSFKNCTALKNLTIGEDWAVNLYLHYSSNLTVESLHGMIENLADLTGQTAKTFQIGSTNLAKIDEEHLTMLQNKNWNYL